MTTKKKSTDLSRRDLLRRSAVGAATVGAVSTGAVRLDHGPVQETEAIAPAVVAGGVGTSMAVGWALREYEVLGSDSPPEGLTADGLRSQSYNTARARLSNDESTFLLNEDIIEQLDHSLYADGKIAAIDGLNDQLQQSEVNGLAADAAREYAATIQGNLVRAWNEAARELRGMSETVHDHPDLNFRSVFTGNMSAGSGGYGSSEQPYPDYRFFEEREIELIDGSNIDIVTIAMDNEDSQRGDDGCMKYNFVEGKVQSFEHNASISTFVDVRNPGDGDNVTYMDRSSWLSIWNGIEDVTSNVTDGLTLYVDKVYSDVQAGELDTGELLTPREQARLTSEDEDFPQAIADLQALNISTDLEREAEIYFSDVEATAYGQLSYTGDTTLSVGTVDPDATDEEDEPIYPGTIYFTYDISQGEGVWSAYDNGVDGGTVTLTSEPFVETVYSVTTTAGETVSFTTDDLEEDESNGEWTVDLSNDLDDQITEVESIEYYADVDGTQYETIQLRDTFEIMDFTDSEGTSYDESDFQRSEPQTDDNYITEEEWQEQQERHEELIEQYEDAQGGGGITIGETSIPTELIGLGLAVAAAIGLIR